MLLELLDGLLGDLRLLLQEGATPADYKAQLKAFGERLSDEAHTGALKKFFKALKKLASSFDTNTYAKASQSLDWAQKHFTELAQEWEKIRTVQNSAAAHFKQHDLVRKIPGPEAPAPRPEQDFEVEALRRSYGRLMAEARRHKLPRKTHGEMAQLLGQLSGTIAGIVKNVGEEIKFLVTDAEHAPDEAGRGMAAVARYFKTVDDLLRTAVTSLGNIARAHL